MPNNEPKPLDALKNLAKKVAGKEQDEDEKSRQLRPYIEEPSDAIMTSDQGVSIINDQDSLKLSERGPTLLEDHFLREKLTHFDHERIPERVVHARGSGAHGLFESYGTGSKFCKAQFLREGVVTPVFVRFSTVAGSRGSTDMARDVRGFATKFYTREGVFDLVGNNIPVFFIQDAIKFPDLVHAVKPEPHNEIPQAQSAHDTFWDFVSLSTESMHMLMWLMSDRAIPRSYRQMEGFGVHTFRMIDERGVSRFVKFHWKPVLGMASVLWDEALKISGKDPDFHRRDLYEAIENGHFPEYELGVQVIEESESDKLGIELLDATKIVPEELVPVQMIGKMTLNRNPANFFAETEQVAFCISHVVPGIDFTDDPLLQGRLFSYLDTQLKRLGGPNFHEIPINRPLAPVHNNQRDGHMRQTINAGRTSYNPNTLGGGCPFQIGENMSGFKSYPQLATGSKIRLRSGKFFDHFSQAVMFWNSQTDIEKMHIIDAFSFELGKCEHVEIRERMVGLLGRVDSGLSKAVAEKLGINLPVQINPPINQQLPADIDPQSYQPSEVEQPSHISPTVSILKNLRPSAKSKRVAILMAPGFSEKETNAYVESLTAAGAMPKIVATHGGTVTGDKGGILKADFALATVGSVLFDGLVVPGGLNSLNMLKEDSYAILFVLETYKHLKAIGTTAEGSDFIWECLSRGGLSDQSRTKLLAKENGIVAPSNFETFAMRQLTDDFIAALSMYRCWGRLMADKIPV